MAGSLVAPSTVAEAKPSAAFPAGRWKGIGVITGGIAQTDVQAAITNPATVTFEVEVAPDGTVVDGVWQLSGATVQVVIPGGSGTASISGSGTLAGTGTRVAVDGSLSISGTVTVQGLTVPLSGISVGAGGGFSPTGASCDVVWGDLSTEARSVQQAAGFSTSVTGPFSAKRIAKAGENLSLSFDETYVELVTAMEQLAAQSPPPVADVVKLATKIDAFYAQVFGSAACADGPKNLEKGKQPYTTFVDKLGQMLLAALQDPNAYSAEDLQQLLLVAIHFGLLGAAAPDPQFAAQLSGEFEAALSSALAKAKAASDHTDCIIVFLAASAGGYSSIAKEAKACA